MILTTQPEVFCATIPCDNITPDMWLTLELGGRNLEEQEDAPDGDWIRYHYTAFGYDI